MWYCAGARSAREGERWSSVVDVVRHALADSAVAEASVCVWGGWEKGKTATGHQTDWHAWLADPTTLPLVSLHTNKANSTQSSASTVLNRP
jgi:hypothetical protein